MDELHPNLTRTRPKVLFIIGSIVVVFVLMLGFFITSRITQTPSKIQVSAPSVVVSPTGLMKKDIPLESKITPVKQIPPGWIPVSIGAFTVYYPNNWNVFSQPITNNSGTRIVLQPSYVPEGVELHELSVQVQPKQINTYQDSVDVFKSFGYASKPIQIAGVSGIKFSGSLGSPNPQFESVAIFEDDNNIYRLLQSYSSGQQNEVMENVFDAILANIQKN
jgi:hypothetical protein